MEDVSGLISFKRGCDGDESTDGNDQVDDMDGVTSGSNIRVYSFGIWGSIMFGLVIIIII